jgi:hypothetical protein
MMMLAERIEARVAAGDDFDLDNFSALTDRISRTLSRLGVNLKRNHEPKGPTLAEYLAAAEGRDDAEADDDR